MRDLSSNQRSKDFLAIADQFKLGELVTESSHPVTADLSEIAKRSIPDALRLLFEVDRDVVDTYREWSQSDSPRCIADTLRDALIKGGNVFFTGCGSTGRLSIQLASIWRDFWQKQRANGLADTEQWENRAHSVMAGGDFALIKSVEGFEDFTSFGDKQIGDMGVGEGDVVFAITEGGETSFVIGTAWKALERGAKVYFVYNNPDDILREHVERSREVIDEPLIEKINLTTGPMAITGSTRMQATSIQLCVMLTILEMVVRALLCNVSGFQKDEMSGLCAEKIPKQQPLQSDDTCNVSGFRIDEISGLCADKIPKQWPLQADDVPVQFLAALEKMHATLSSKPLCNDLAKLVELEERVYRCNGKNNYFANSIAVDVLTDTTERSPTYCTPPFRKFDDTSASESWAFLYLPYETTEEAWNWILKKQPQCVEWAREEVRALVPEDKVERQYEIVTRIGCKELMRFKIGKDGLENRPLERGDSAIGILLESEIDSLASPDGFIRKQLEAAQSTGASTGLIAFGHSTFDFELSTPPVLVPVPRTDLLLNGVTRVGVKMLLNALSTCTMVRLGRVMGNYMIYVVPSNLKLIDRSTRYISKLTGLTYEEANALLFEVLEYIEPRMKADQQYPPIVGLSVIRAIHNIGNADAEIKLMMDD